MPVNSACKRIFNNSLVAGSGVVVAALIIFFIASSFTEHPDRDLWAKQVNLTIRQMGHRLLLQAGDSTSRVLPVTEIRQGTFQLSFEKEFAFNHDSLLVLSQDLLPKAQFPSGYTITVHECMKADIAYGFQINNSIPDVLPCVGRNQPPGCYVFEIAVPDLFETLEPKKADAEKLSVFSGIMVLLGVTLLIGGLGKILRPVSVKRRHQSTLKEPVLQPAGLGKFLFDVKEQRLLFGDDVIDLTDKECRILELLNSNFGELTTRETLMQKVWINEGVITSRSLDMFVSKLRKKLGSDPELRITNVHGKGYKLERAAPGSFY